MTKPSYRPYYVEWRGNLRLDSPVHIGTGEDWRVSTDMPVVAEERKPFLPGTSLRGVVREHLRRECRLLGCTPQEVQELFGRFEEKGKDDAENELSRLRFFDAYSEQRLPTEVRDHVRIEGKSGAAADQGKYDMEAVLPVEENLEFRLIYEGEAKSEKDELLIGEALRALCEGEIRIGAKSGWGYGRIHLERDSVERVAFDRSRPEELARFLEFRLDPKKHKAKATLGENDAEAEETGDALTTLEFRIALQMDGPMLVKSAVPRPRPEGRGSELEILGSPERYAEEALYAADHAPVQSRGRAYLPGASLRGVLRAQAL